jgi:hypothetical protein
VTVSLLGMRVWRLQDGGCGSSKCLPEPKDPPAPSLYGSSTTRVANHGYQTLRRVCLFYPAFCTHLVRKTHCGVFFCFLVCLFAVPSFCLLLFVALVVTATHEALRESKKNKVEWVEFETSCYIVQALISALWCISLTDYESGF